MNGNGMFPDPHPGGLELLDNLGGMRHAELGYIQASRRAPVHNPQTVVCVGQFHPRGKVRENHGCPEQHFTAGRDAPRVAQEARSEHDIAVLVFQYPEHVDDVGYLVLSVGVERDNGTGALAQCMGNAGLQGSTLADVDQVREAEGCGQTEPSFVNLVRTYSGDQSPVQMLDELLRVGAVIETEPQRYKPLRRDFEADRLSPKLIERFGDISFNLLTTLSFNVQKEKIGEGIFDRRVLSNQKLNANELELFESYLKSRGQQFLEEVDNWLTGTVVHKAEGATEVYDSGLAMIHYTTLEPELKQTLHELLVELGLDEATNGKGKNILKE